MSAKVLVRVPVSHDHGAIKPHTHNSIVNLAMSGFPMVGGECFLAGSVFVLRDLFARELLKRPDCTHLLMIDSDMCFTHQHAWQLLRHRKQVVAGVYRRRAGEEFVAGSFDGERMVHLPGRSLEVRDWCGLGFILIDRTVFEKLPDPWFAHVAEDLHFCRSLKRAGIPIFVDYDCHVDHVALGVIR